MKDKNDDDNIESFKFEDNDEHKYLLFRLGEEQYGTPLLGIREIIEPQPSSPVANASPFFMGIMNLRGQIIGVIDLRIRLGFPPVKSPTTVLFVFDTAEGTLATIVDEVLIVTDIKPEAIERKPNIVTKMPAEYLLGIGNTGKKLVTLVDLPRLLSQEELHKATLDK